VQRNRVAFQSVRLAVSVPVFVERADGTGGGFTETEVSCMSAPRSQRVRTTERAPSGPCESTARTRQTRCSSAAPGAALQTTYRNDSNACDQSMCLRLVFRSWSFDPKSAANRAALLEHPGLS
jgi:hypothetical protein